MSEYTQSMLFPQVAGKEVVVDFDGGDLTSDGGLLLLREADRIAGVTSAMAGSIRDRRQQSKVDHSAEELLRSRVHAICCGYSDANDLDALRHDAALKLASGRCPLSGGALGSQPTVSRFENRVTSGELLKMAESMAARVIAQLPATTKWVILDIDASDDPCHGQQEFEGFNGYYDCHCFMPLFAHLTDDQGRQWPLAAILRPGRVNPIAGVRGLLKRVVRLLRERWPKLVILVRGDSGFGCHEVLLCCDRLKIHYLFGLASNTRLKVLGQATQELCQVAYESADGASTGESSVFYSEFLYKAHSWPRCRDTFIKVEMTEGKLNPRYVVSDLHEWDGAVLNADGIYDLYCGRGDQENRIKELKLDLESGRTSCHRFLANQMRLLQHLAAHILWTVVRVAAAGTMWAKAQVSTMRLQLVKVAARVRETTRRVWLHLGTAYPYQKDWRRLHQRLCARTTTTG